MRPLYKQNRTVIEDFSKTIEKLFNQNSEKLKKQVANSAG
jgi:hypothetical protein